MVHTVWVIFRALINTNNDLGKIKIISNFDFINKGSSCFDVRLPNIVDLKLIKYVFTFHVNLASNKKTHTLLHCIFDWAIYFKFESLT